MTVEYKRVLEYYYGLDLFELDDGSRYAQGTNEAVMRAAHRSILEKLWTFSSLTIHDFLVEVKSPCLLLQEEISNIKFRLGQDSNEFIRRLLLPHEEEFCKKMIKKYSRGYFLARYDHKEKLAEEVGLEKSAGSFCYRIK